MFCHNCGSEALKEYLYCSQCRTKLDIAVPSFRLLLSSENLTENEAIEAYFNSGFSYNAILCFQLRSIMTCRCRCQRLKGGFLNTTSKETKQTSICLTLRDWYETSWMAQAAFLRDLKIYLAKEMSKKQCTNTRQIIEVSNSTKRHADNSGNQADIWPLAITRSNSSVFSL